MQSKINTIDSKGFTLFELSIVIAIISSLTTVSFIYTNSMKLDNCARQIFLDLHYARMRAIRERNNYRVIFDNSSGYKYSIHDDQNNDHFIDGNEKVIHKYIKDYFRDITFYTDLTPAFDIVNFTLMGTANFGTITITDGKYSKKLIVLKTGSIKKR